jgi:hypothetical protein
VAAWLPLVGAAISVTGALLAVCLAAWLTWRRERREARADALEAIAEVRQALYGRPAAEFETVLDRVEARVLRVDPRAFDAVSTFQQAAADCWVNSRNSVDPELPDIDHALLAAYEEARTALRRMLLPQAWRK